MSQSNGQPKAPRIDCVQDLTCGRSDLLTPGGLFTIAGHGFGSHQNVPNDIGVYVNCNATGELVRVHNYVLWREDEIRGHWPTGLHGTFWLFVETAAGDGLIHSAVHAHPLRLSHAPAVPPGLGA